MIISFNGKIIDEKKVTISVTSEAFLFGQAVFETLRTYHKKIFRLEDHLKRLYTSAQAMGLKPRWTAKKTEAEIFRVLALDKGKKEIKMRVILTNDDPILMLEELEEKPEKMYKEGVKCVSFVGQRSLPEIKKIGDSLSFIAKKHATSHNSYEAILVDEKGFVSECAYANIFWVKGGKLYTTNKKILFGITREVVIELAEKCLFADIKLSDLLKADEIFLTQSTSGILPIVEVDGERIGGGEVGVMTKELMEKFISLISS